MATKIKKATKTPEEKYTAELDYSFNAAEYIGYFNPVCTSEGFRLKVEPHFTTSYYPVNSHFGTWNEEKHSYSADHKVICFRNFKGLNQAYGRIPLKYLPFILSHLYVVFKPESVFRYKSGAVCCLKSKLYCINPESKKGNDLILLSECTGDTGGLEYRTQQIKNFKIKKEAKGCILP